MNKKNKLKIIAFAIMASLLFIVLFINQCRFKCNCMNESICPGSCKMLLLPFGINDCPYDDSEGYLDVEDFQK